MIFYLLLFIIAIALDQVTKFLTTHFYDLYDVKEIIPHILSFTYIRNEGAAFGILQGARVFFVILTIVVFIAIVIYFLKDKPETQLEKLALTFIAGGAAGNFIDRLLLGYVRDFIMVEFIDFPVFNIADCFVCIGAGLYILYAVMDLFKQKKEDLNHGAKSN